MSEFITKFTGAVFSRWIIPPGSHKGEWWVMLSIFYHQNKVPFHCVDLVYASANNGFRKRIFFLSQSVTCKTSKGSISATFQSHIFSQSCRVDSFTPYCSLRTGNLVPRQRKIPTQYISETAWHAKTGPWTFYTAWGPFVIYQYI